MFLVWSETLLSILELCANETLPLQGLADSRGSALGTLFRTHCGTLISSANKNCVQVLSRAMAG